MSDRRSQQMTSDGQTIYSMQQWAAPQYQSGYSVPSGHYPPACNPHPSLRQQSAVAQPNPYEAMLVQQNALAEYPTMDREHPYSHDRTSLSPPQHSGYPSAVNAQNIAISHSTGRMQAPTASQAYHDPRHQAMLINTYATGQHYPSQSSSQHPSSMSLPPPSQYPAQVSFASQADVASQYPASPQRPFSCDMCALSFNRQHDLKRHRDTHTGEKPFLCNGGCGKTFTRKDALKRHQLVKRCGIDEGA
ncbi:hypothetical protein C8Q75DRAFT_322887 [Abortiporus biennis]|nr:hypothetical protein C8Q75DRAFT_322887 [Abortiporus biennis]